jgi:hypothetical protein
VSLRSHKAVVIQTETSSEQHRYALEDGITYGSASLTREGILIGMTAGDVDKLARRPCRGRERC